MGLVFNRTAEGWVVKCQAMVDDAIHEAVVIEMKQAITERGVSKVLDRLVIQRGLPRVIRTEKFEKFAPRAMVV